MTHIQRGLNRHRRDGIGQDVFSNDPEFGVSDNPRRVYIVLLSYLEDLASDDSGVTRPHDRLQRHHDVDERRPQDHGDRQREDKSGYGEEDIHCPHQNRVHLAAHDSGRRPHDQT